MYEYQAWKKFKEETNHPEKILSIDEISFNYMLREEIEHENKRIKNNGGRKLRSDTLIDIAVKRMIEWFNHGNEYHFVSYRQFVETYRKTCCWCVFLRKEYDEAIRKKE